MNMTTPQSLISARLIDPAWLGSWMADRTHIWQMDLLSADDLLSFAEKRGLSFGTESLIRLWDLGLLRADLVVSDRKSRYPGFRYASRHVEGSYLYIDVRPFSTSWSIRISSSLPSLPSGVRPLFHPFRYYVLYHLNRVLSLNGLSMQPLVRPEGYYERYHKQLDFSLSLFDQWASSAESLQVVEKWNDTAALAIVAEPCLYTPVLGVFHWSFPVDEETQRKHISEHWVRVLRCYRRLSVQRIEEIRQELCVATQSMDSNRDVHTLLCLGYGEERLKLEDRLGGAMVLRTMAEMLRRATERAHKVQLPEEDELGFGWVVQGVKKQVFGSNRVLDRDWRAADEFARQFGLRYGHHVRWYVEGDTEFWALRWILEKRLKITDITIINLRGQVAEKAKKGAAFRDSLVNDIKARRFSIVSIDGDRSDFFYAVRKAAQDDEICGAFFISKPDFEMFNFERLELEGVVWALAKDNGATPNDYSSLQSAIEGWETVNDLLNRASKGLPHLPPVFKKGQLWGESLIKFAWERQRRKEQLRPVIEAIHIAVRAWRSNYHLTRCTHLVDPKTGKLVKRATPRETED